MIRRPILIGEDNPQHSDPRYALYPLPARCAGGRLARILGAPSSGAYLQMFERYNLCTGKWNAKEARRRAAGLLMLYWPNPKILLGLKVAEAFDMPYEPFAQTWYSTREGVCKGRGPDLVLPHPSGRCRAWNVPGTREKARKAFEEVACG